MEGEHTLTIIRLILSTNLTLIQLKDSYFNSSFFSTIPHNEWIFKELTHKETDFIVKDTLEKNCIRIGELGLEPSIAKDLSDLLANQ